MDWDPTQFFRPSKPASPMAILILNQPINERAFGTIRKHACYILCADGGANRYYDLMRDYGRADTDLPSAILGDLDSIRPNVRQHYEDCGVPVLHDPDQYSTDFTKCLRHLRTYASRIVSATVAAKQTNVVFSKAWAVKTAEIVSRKDDPPHLDVLVFGGLGGRVDQAFSQINHLYTMAQSEHPTTIRSEGDLYLISEESISFVLRPGRNIVYTPRTDRPSDPQDSDSSQSDQQTQPDSFYLRENIGIIPIAGPAEISTRGFEWDVANWRTEVGGQISTSNHIRADVVQIETNWPVLFTVELATQFKLGGKAR